MEVNGVPIEPETGGCRGLLGSNGVTTQVLWPQGRQRLDADEKIPAYWTC